MITQEEYNSAKITIIQYEKQLKDIELAKSFEDEGWSIIKELGWGTDTTDYEVLKVVLTKKYSKDKIKQLEKFAITKANELQHAFNVMTTDVIDLGDDNFSDLIFHIVGLGKEEYERVMKNKQLAVERADAYDFEESFLYIFP